MTDEPLKLSPHQISDVEAASEVIYSKAAETVLKTPKTSLGPDMTALVAIFLVIVVYHIQNPLLQFETQFGQAFRNKSLQTVLALGLVVILVPLAGNMRRYLGFGQSDSQKAVPTGSSRGVGTRFFASAGLR